MNWLIPQFGFSYIGLIFLILLFVPNLLWVKNKPEGYDSAEESRALQLLERVGEVLVTVMVLSFAALNLRPWSGWSWFLMAAAVCMVLYEGFWLRYFRGGHTLEDFYGSFCGVPVAGATLPVLAAACLGLYAKSLWLVLAAAALGVGHIGIHLKHRKNMNTGPESEKSC